MYVKENEGTLEQHKIIHVYIIKVLHTLLGLPARISYGLSNSKVNTSRLLLHCISIVMMLPSTPMHMLPLCLAMHFLSNTQHPITIIKQKT